MGRLKNNTVRLIGQYANYTFIQYNYSIIEWHINILFSEPAGRRPLLRESLFFNAEAVLQAREIARPDIGGIVFGG
jgi:hypothetical protein